MHQRLPQEEFPQSLLPRSHRIYYSTLGILETKCFRSRTLLCPELPAHQHCSSINTTSCSLTFPTKLLLLKGSFLLTHLMCFVKINVKGRKGRRSSLASEKMPNLLEILLKSMISSATSLQNPLPWLFIQIKLHSAKQNKKCQPCAAVSDPWTAHPCCLLHG